MPPRRSILRVAQPPPAPRLRSQRQLQRLRDRLQSARSALVRWQTRLKRAFNTVEKHQKQIIRLERQLARVEED